MYSGRSSCHIWIYIESTGSGERLLIFNPAKSSHFGEVINHDHDEFLADTHRKRTAEINMHMLQGPVDLRRVQKLLWGVKQGMALACITATQNSCDIRTHSRPRVIKAHYRHGAIYVHDQEHHAI